MLRYTNLASAKFHLEFNKRDNRIRFPNNFVGSNLFGDGKFVKRCFSTEDVALLSARSKFEVRCWLYL